MSDAYNRILSEQMRTKFNLESALHEAELNMEGLALGNEPEANLGGSNNLDLNNESVHSPEELEVVSYRTHIKPRPCTLLSDRS